jgi:hypothetical protein
MARNAVLGGRKHLRLLPWLKLIWWQRYRIAQRAKELRADQIEASLSGLWDGLRGRGGPYAPPRAMPALVRKVLFPGLLGGALAPVGSI